MLLIRTGFLSAFCLIASLGFSQQKWPNTLLWRITGNHLSKPSYLYGTMHLEDKRLFQFGDSLYRSLENVEGFALEIDFNEFVDSIFSREFQNVEDEELARQRVKIDRKKLNNSADSMLRKLGINEDYITKKDLKKVRDYRTNKLVQKGEMPTIVDGYLYGLALRLGKWTGGIEDINDQLDLSDELGKDLSPDQVFQPEKSLQKSLDEMIRIYVDKDLQALANYVDGKLNPSEKDEWLIHRNFKMARRMDSLSALRSMFFAVGAAHLPGDSGVINLLRGRGFTVEPVFSPQSLSPESYSSKLNTLPWRKVDDDKLYSVDMPGIPSDYNIFGEAVKMKVYFDLPTMTVYMAGHTIAGENVSVNMDEAFKNMAMRMGNSTGKIQSKDIMVNGLQGKEGSFDVEEGSYKVRFLQKKNTFYIVLAGSTKQLNLNSADIARFFSSFIAKDAISDDKKWTAFTIPGKGFSVKLPGVPKANKKIDATAKSSNWDFVTYDFVDEAKGFYYLVQVRDLKQGYFLEGDTTYFSAFKENLSGRSATLVSQQQFQYHGWPAFRMTMSESNGLYYNFFSVIRGNRVYSFIVGGGSKGTDFSDVDTVFNSFSLEEYKSVEWQTISSDGFRTTAPSTIVKIEDTTGRESKFEHFVSYDPEDANSYEIFKKPLSPLYWTKDDSSFYATRLNLYKTFGDSVISQKVSYNGNLKGLDASLQKAGSNTVKRLRIFVCGDSLYTLLAYLPKQYLENGNSKRFFDDFVVANPVQPTIYTKKTAQLLKALQTKDSAEFSKLSEVFTLVSFNREDKALLEQALFARYLKPENAFSTINEKIADDLSEFADDSTVSFVSENFRQLDSKSDSVKYTLLYLLSKIKTRTSYSALKELLLSSLPHQGETGRLTYALKDSLKLAASLYPDVLILSKDSLFSNVLVDLTQKLLDSNLVSVKDLAPYKANFLLRAKKNLAIVRANEENWWSYSDWVPFIGRFNDNESNALLREFLKLHDVNIKYASIIALIRNNQPVDPAEIEKVAQEKSLRKDLYEEFKKMNRGNLFPSKYASQIKIAESELFQMGNDDEEVSQIIFIGQRTQYFKGEKQYFYLFKVSYGNDDEPEAYLGIAGPYSFAKKEIITNSDATGIYWDETYDKDKTDSQFKKYLSSVEDRLKKK